MNTPSVIEIQDVSKRYVVESQSLPVLESISLTIEAGEFVSIVGASGCGKSTLLRLLVGLDDRYQGEIRINGVRLSGTSLDRGIVFQEHRLFPWLTVAQNVALGLENSSLSPERKQRAVAEHIALVGLSGFESAYPHRRSPGAWSTSPASCCWTSRSERSTR
jgi:sulfonate transport system ATP-binding protein